MKKPLVTLVVGLALGAVLPAWAGPDWQVIEQVRKAQQAKQKARHSDPSQAVSASRAAPQTCPPSSLVLPLDHGPRAQTTPFQNRRLQARHEAQLKACTKQA